MSLLRVIARFVGVLCAVFLMEAGYFTYILMQKNADPPSDAIVVFMGTDPRMKAGYDLAGQGLAPRLVLSPSTEALRDRWDQKFGLKKPAAQVVEDKATNTLGNAFYASRIIKDENWKTLILVTSDYHMPRSLALLKLFLAGDPVRIHPYMIRGGGLNVPLLKLVYNEMMNFWGSMVEYAMFRLDGKVVQKPETTGGWMRLLRSAVLLDVTPAW